MPLAAACLITGLSASRSDGLTMIALTPAEIRLRRSAICSDGPPLRLATTTLETTPEASAWALIEQIISSRQPLPISGLDTPTTYLSAAEVLPAAAASSSPRQASLASDFIGSSLGGACDGVHRSTSSCFVPRQARN